MISQAVKASFVADRCHGNEMFDRNSSRNRDNCLEPFIALHESFKMKGVELNSRSINRNICTQFELHLDVQKKSNKVITKYAILFESPQVKPINQSSLYLAKYRIIFTWRDDLVDGKRFIKFYLPNKFFTNDAPGWKERNKLCCLISANKNVLHKTPQELYSERVKTIRWFENNAPHDFDLFGQGWDAPAAKPGFVNLSLRKIKHYLLKAEGKVYFSSYRGVAASKLETMQKYRFSICYDNVRDLPGYITEKIWDSFFAGCIPVYWGATNITNYIPEDCFIDRRKFANHEELYNFMISITEAEYTAYQDKIASFLLSEKAHLFSAKSFAETITNTILRDLSRIKPNKNFENKTK